MRMPLTSSKMIIDLTLDNMYRHPLRWGRITPSVTKVYAFGVSINTDSWFVMVFFGRKYWFHRFSGE